MKPTIEQRASQASRLRDDEAFVSFVQEVKDAQAAVFLNPASSAEDREAAHQMIRAIHAIEERLAKAENDWKIQQRKGQHRGND